MSSQVWWIASRSAGLIAWAMLSLSIIWGLQLSTKTMKKAIKRPWLLGTHQTLGGLATVFVLVHTVTLLFDKFTNFNLIDLFVPFSSSWHPVWVAWGVVGAWMLLAVEVTSLIKKHLSKKVWHSIHMLSFLLWIVGTIHGFLSGPDSQTMIAIATATFVAVPIFILTILRLYLWVNEPIKPSRIPIRN